MEGLNEVKNWILNEVLPHILQSAKLSKNHKSVESVGDTNKSFKVLNISVTSIGTDEAFMLTKCYRIKLDYNFESEVRSSFLMAKKTPSISPENYGTVDFVSLFGNEITAYKIIIPSLLRFSKAEENESKFPIYYYGNLGAFEASIVLGDFNSDGWKMSKSRVNLSLEHILLGAQYIGVFHGLCYALKDIDRTKFDYLIGLLKESRFSKPISTHWSLLVKAGMQRFDKILKNMCPEIPADFIQKLMKLLSDSYSYCKKRVEPIEPYATICHGDYLRNNMAFAYDNNEDPDIPTNVMMFDFQTLRYSSPMIDLCLFFSLSAGQNVRQSNFNKIFDAYHNGLITTFAKYAEVDLPPFLSKPNMLKEYIRFLPYSLSIAITFLSTLHDPDGMSQEEILGDMDSMDLDQILKESFARGGEVVDEEIASLATELYNFTVQENIDIFDGFL